MEIWLLSPDAALLLHPSPITYDDMQQVVLARDTCRHELTSLTKAGFRRHRSGIRGSTSSES
jgi:hypothetical protein